MTNYEKYKDLVISCISKDSICDLAHVAYGNESCAIRSTCKECWEFTAEWAKREYIGIEWAKVEADTPVIIKDEKGIMFRHFAKYYRGHVFVYANGQTSWTNDDETEAWEPENVKFARDEDFKKYVKQ